MKKNFVIKEMGRMTYVKNHDFLFRLFARLLEKRPDAALILVGTGEREEELKRLSASLGIASAVHFLGNRSDTAELYQAMDVFVLPSHVEGVPLVGIEAQYAGLPCLFSAGVPREVGFSRSCAFRALSDPYDLWVEDILSLCPATDRTATPESSVYDIAPAAAALQERYEKILLN